ncbi:MAG: universal stress protein [Nocardioidaceae bacterium]
MAKAAHPIVVGYDGSADSDRALDWAVSAARQRSRPLRLVAVLDDAAPDWLPEQVKDAQRQAAERLSDAGDRSGGLPVTIMQPRHEEATHALLRLSDDADLVVLGSHGHGVLAGMLIGSVSQHLSRHATCPVVVVRQPHDAGSKRIVIGFDDSPGSERALEFGFDTARAWRAPLTVVHGWRYSTAGPVGMFLPEAPDIAEEITSERAKLRDALVGWIEKYPEVKVAHEAIPYHPVRALADASEHATLVVVGSRGRGTFTGMLLGSVSQGILQRARCSVAVAR